MSASLPKDCNPNDCPPVIDAKNLTKVLKLETDVLLTRITEIESRHTEFVRSVDNKLDKIMNLANVVASLQERMIHQADDLSEVRGALKEMERVIREGLEKSSEKINDISKELGEKITSSNIEVKAQIDKVQTHVLEVESTSNKWINRITGGVAVIGVVMGVVQWFVLDYIGSARHREEEYRAKLADMERKVIQVEINLAKSGTEIYPSQLSPRGK